LALEGKVWSETIWMPDWYPLIKAARYLGVAPWELLAQSVWWREKALIAESAENYARAEIEKHR
jgi:hypothetical protein